MYLARYKEHQLTDTASIKSLEIENGRGKKIYTTMKAEKKRNKGKYLQE